jgi:hypothetical protein
MAWPPRLTRAEYERDPSRLWVMAELHGRVLVVGHRGETLIDLATYGGPTGLSWQTGARTASGPDESG